MTFLLLYAPVSHTKQDREVSPAANHCFRKSQCRKRKALYKKAGRAGPVRSEHSSLIIEYVQRFGGFDGFFAKENVAGLTHAAGVE